VPRKKRQHPDELTTRRQEFDVLRKEALSYGVALFTDRLKEAREAVQRLRVERHGKPPCFKRVWSATDPRCGVCDLRWQCSGSDSIPAEIPANQIDTVTCQTCTVGVLSLPRTHPASGAVIDYGCTTPGCPGSLVEQFRWSEETPESKEVKVEVMPGRPRRHLVDLEDAIVGVLRKGKKATLPDFLREFKDDGEFKIRKALDHLIEEGIITRKRGSGYWLKDSGS
jgi:hypothetical protein